LDKVNYEKKIAFVADDFGFFTGHGGVGSYLVSMVEYILRNYPEMSVYLLINRYDKGCPLIKSKIYIFPLLGMKMMFLLNYRGYSRIMLRQWTFEACVPAR